MKHYFPISFISIILAACILSGCRSNKPFFYNYPGELDLGKPLLVDAEPSNIVPIFDVNNVRKGYTIYKDSCVFNVIVDDKGLINGISTFSKKFKVNGFQVGDTIKDFTGKFVYLRGFSKNYAGREIGDGWCVMYDKKHHVIWCIYKK